MRIQQLDLRAFGPFTGASLDLSAGRQGLHMIVGPNEAGKSTTLRGLRQMLFGFDHGIADNYLHNEKTIRIGGVLRDESGNEVAFLRRRGRKKTLRTLDDSADLDDEALAPFLGPLTAERFRTQFGLDHETLSRGSKAALDSGGELGQLLFGVGLDLGGLREYQVRLRNEADELFVSTRASSKAIPTIVQKYKATCEELRKNSLPGAEWTEAQEELARLLADRQRIEADLLAAHREKSRLQRIDDAIPDLARRKNVLAELQSLDDVILLRDDFSETRRAVEESRRVASRELETAREELAIIARSLESISVPETLLGDESSIRDLFERSGNHTKGQTDLVKRRGEHRQLSESIQALLRDLGRPEDLHAAESLRLTAATKSVIPKLVDDFKTYQFELKAAQKDFSDAQLEVARLTEELDGLAEPPDLGPLERAVARALKVGEIEKAITTERNRLKRLQNDWERDRARLAIPVGDSLDALALPSAEAIERHAKRLEALEAETEKLRESLAKLRKDEKALRRQYATLQKQGETPTEADLDQARETRDASWEALKTSWSDAGVAEFERHLAHVDSLGDRLRREATRVLDYVRCIDAIRAAEEDAAATQQALDQVERQTTEALADWHSVWEGLIDHAPRPPREMLSWRAQVEALIAGLRNLDELRDGLAARESQAAEVRDDLHSAASGLGHPLARTKGLQDALDLGQELANRLQELGRRRSRLVEGVGLSKLKVRNTRQQRVDAEEQISRWRTAWGRALAPLGLDESASADLALSTLKAFETLATELDKLATLGGRIRGLERDQEEFETHARELLSRVAPDLANELPAAAVKQCWGRLDLAKAARNQRDHLLDERAKYERSLRNATRERLAADEKLAALCKEASCDDPAELPDREARSARRRALENERTELEKRLARLTGGEPLDAFIALASSQEVDEVRARRLAIDDEIHGLDARRVSCDQSIGAIQNTIAVMEGRSRDGKAEASAAEAQHLLVKITTHVEQYSRLRLASAILGQVIERYRQGHQAPLLAKASAFFRQLTGGAFHEVRSDLDDKGKPRLVGLRGSQGEEVEIEGMSTGTVDQLYLALKLASLEHYLDHNPAMPFIIDDVLVQFDDDRALAALRAFAALSARTQVIFFTHHRHLVDLARGELADDVLFVHSLERRNLLAS